MLMILACNKSGGTSNSGQGFREGFDTASAAFSRGWATANASVGPGQGKWDNPADPTPFDPWASTSTNKAYLFVDHTSTSSAQGIISNWLISPVRNFNNGDKIIFYTRAQILYYDLDSTDFANRMQVWLSSSGNSADVGSGENTGQFTNLLLDINPQYQEYRQSEFLSGTPESRKAYPHGWTRFEVTLTGLKAPVSGRFAFRYFVEDGGSNGRGSGIGLDEVSYIPVPYP
jgi:hypothetical protein